jgi:putative glutamine amidotransferase
VSGEIVVATGTDEYAAPYVEALKAAGVPAERIRVVTPDGEPIPELCFARGLVLCGGVDVVPERYGEETLPFANVETFPERDVLEWGLLDAARAAQIPVWAVCRGLQVVNVYLGGSLYQDLPLDRPGTTGHSIAEPPDTLAHSVRLLPRAASAGAARMAELLAHEAPLVNSRHHQGIKRLAPRLAAVAESPDGLIEAVTLQADDSWWLRAVQWHPENLVALPEQRALWQDFVHASCGEVR